MIAQTAKSSTRSTAVDVRSHGLVPNDPSMRAANSTKLRALLERAAPEPMARVLFSPLAGADTYYFDATVIMVRDGIWLDLCGCTLDFAGSASASDVNSGMLFAMRAFGIENGAIKVAVDTTAASGSGYAIQIGARGADSPYITVYDKLLAEPLGNVFIRNLAITVNNTGTHLTNSGAIDILGGVFGLVCENVSVDGCGTLRQAIAYEFGWATKPAGHQTSHGRNLFFRNIQIRNMDTQQLDTVALVVAGADSVRVDGLRVTDASCGLSITPGESLFYDPWRGKHSAGAQRAIDLRNIVLTGFTSTGILLIGAQRASGGYLARRIGKLGHPADYRAQTDLLDVTLDGFALNGTANAAGILNSAGHAIIRNGRITGCQRGLISTDEATRVTVERVDVLTCRQMGMTFDQGAAIWNPPRKKTLTIRNCFIAGNSTSRAGAYYAIHLGRNLASADIEDCRFGHDPAHDGQSETTQAGSVFVSTPNARNVKCRRNRSAAPVGPGNAAYFSNASAAQGCRIEGALGDASVHGRWVTDQAPAR
jgi:hypothetical protein